MESSLAARALTIIKETRDISFPLWGNAERMHKTSLHDVVTEADRDIEERLRAEFAKLDPGISFVGEEFGGDRTAERLWLCDPIDGTISFVRGLPFCTTMLALVEEGEVVFSAIYDFVQDRMYHAEKGAGAFCDDTRLLMSTRPVEESCIGYETRFEDARKVAAFQKTLEKIIFIKTPTAGYELVQVAAGRIEGRIGDEPYGHDYDFAPGALLVQEAGGVVTNIGSDSYDYRDTNHIIATPALHAWLTRGPDAIFPVKG